MPELVTRGTTVTLDAFYEDSNAAATDAVTDPRVSIITAGGSTVINLAVPTHVGLGHWQYVYFVPVAAELGAWDAVWFGIVDGQQTGPVADGFTVVTSAALVPVSPSSPICSAWATVDDVCSPCDDYSFDTALLDDSLVAASEILFELSGRQFSGECEATVRPCTRRTMLETLAYYGNTGDSAGLPGGFLSQLRVMCGCNRSRTCGCSTLSEITLGGYPIVSVDEVKIDGAVLNAARYRVDDSRWLVRLPDADGTFQSWPCCQRLELPSTEENTFEVTFTYGRNPPVAGVRAAARLGCELALACSPETAGKCQLNQRVQQVTRQGVTVVLDRLSAIKEGFTSLPEVDLFIRAINPAGLDRRAQVLSPDIGRRIRRAGT